MRRMHLLATPRTIMERSVPPALAATYLTFMFACGPDDPPSVGRFDAGTDGSIPTGPCFDGKGGAPEVFIGGGQTDYLPIANGTTVKAEAGPQGGHHVWIGIRMKNLGQSLTRTILRGEAGGMKIPETAVVFSYGPDEGGYCKLFGIRYQFDVDSAGRNIDYRPFLGKPLKIEVELVDQRGRSVKKTLDVVLADSL
jgi:hypothetical protein